MRKVLILGSKGMLGGQLMGVFGNEAVGWDRADCDVTEVESLKLKVSAGVGSAFGGESLKPSAIINCVAYNDVDGAEENRDLAFRLNAEVPANLALICKELDIPFVHFSTNYVFDPSRFSGAEAGGEKGEYLESDIPSPLSVYAKSKYQGELEIQKIGGKFYIIRTATLFGPKGESEQSKKSFVDIMLGLGKKGGDIKAVADEINSITYAVDLAGQIKLLLDHDSPYGIYHIVNSGQGSWYDFAREIFSIAGKNVNLIPVASADFNRKAERPKKAVLLNTKLPPLRSWQEALKDFLTLE
jgi:dTDP-4-dehydrorhamnose reductase